MVRIGIVLGLLEAEVGCMEVRAVCRQEGSLREESYNRDSQKNPEGKG